MPKTAPFTSSGVGILSGGFSKRLNVVGVTWRKPGWLWAWSIAVLNSGVTQVLCINNYSYYLSLREEKLEYAESLSKKSIIAEPNNSTFLDTYAWILFKLKRFLELYPNINAVIYILIV